MSDEIKVSVSMSETMVAARGAIAKGSPLVYDAALGAYVLSTAANRAAANARTQGFALKALGSNTLPGTVTIQQAGVLPAALSGIGAGAGGQLVRVTDAGGLERVTQYTAGDDVVGYSEADGRVHLHLGIPWGLIAIAASGGVVSVKTFGVTGNGVTDDTTALSLAIAFQQATGCLLIGMPGTAKLSSWSTLTTTAPLYFDGQGITLKCTNAASVAFMTAKANVRVAGTTFDGFFRTVDNRTSVLEALTEVRFTGCRFINPRINAGSNFPYYILIQSPVTNVWIVDNVFDAAVGAAILIGNKSYVDQDTWGEITIRGNRLNGCTNATYPSGTYGFLVYGRDVTVDGNMVSDVESPAGAFNASNEAYGIYVAAKRSRVVNNSVRNVGVINYASCTFNLISGINIKGSERGGEPGGGISPEGYAVVVANNVVIGVGHTDTHGTGINTDHSGVLFDGNWIESGRIGIVAPGDGTSSPDGYVITNNYIVVGDDSTVTKCVDLINPGGDGPGAVVTGNHFQGGKGVQVRASLGPTQNVTISANVFNCVVGVWLSPTALGGLAYVSVTNNIMTRTGAGTIGVRFDTSTTTYTNVLVANNDFSRAATPVSGTFPTGVRMRNNRGYVSENGGLSTAIASGGSIPHGCATAPAILHLQPQTGGTGTRPASVACTISGSNIVVTFDGGGTYAFYWEAKTAAFYA